MSAVDSPFVSSLLGTFPRQRFFEEHWETASLHLPHTDEGRFLALVDLESFFAEEVFLCRHLKQATVDPAGWMRESKLLPDDARESYEGGATICASVLQLRAELKELIVGLEQEVLSPAPLHVNAYLSPDGAGYSVHMDPHPVWILQVEGTKRWWVGKSPVLVAPRTNVVFPPDRDVLELPGVRLERPRLDDTALFHDITLSPGDVLYVPAGCWHQAKAIGNSLALTIAPGKVTSLELVEMLLRQVAERKAPGLDERLSSIPRGVPATREVLLTHFERDIQLLRRFFEKLERTHLLTLFEELSYDVESRRSSGAVMDAAAQAKKLLKR